MQSTAAERVVGKEEVQMKGSLFRKQTGCCEQRLFPSRRQGPKRMMYGEDGVWQQGQLVLEVKPPIHADRGVAASTGVF